MFGVIIACIQLNRNIKAHQDEHSPVLVVYSPKNTDPINKLEVWNKGNLPAQKIHIDVYRLDGHLPLFHKKVYTKKIILLEVDGHESIYCNSDSAEIEQASEIMVKIKYNSPLHNRKLSTKQREKRN
jgi:hypothetical protein